MRLSEVVRARAAWLARTGCLAALLAAGCTTAFVNGPDKLPATADLPLVVVPAGPGAHEEMAVMLSGDGGWRALDKNVSASLARAGVPVVGLVSPLYLERRRSPEELASALQRIMDAYEPYWGAEKVILVGYSRGAGILPFMVSRLSPEQRARIARIALLGLEPTIDFKVTRRAILSGNDPDERQIPVAPELEKLRGLDISCFRGESESDSLCRQLPPFLAREVVEPGGHHFGGKYETLAAEILGAHRK